MAREQENHAMLNEKKNTEKTAADTADELMRELAIAMGGALIKRRAERYEESDEVDRDDALNIEKLCGGHDEVEDRIAKVVRHARVAWCVPKDKRERSTAICCAWQTVLADTIAMAAEEGDMDNTVTIAVLAKAYADLMTEEFGEPKIDEDMLANFLTNASQFGEDADDDEDVQPDENPDEEQSEPESGKTFTLTFTVEQIAAVKAALEVAVDVLGDGVGDIIMDAWDGAVKTMVVND